MRTFTSIFSCISMLGLAGCATGGYGYPPIYGVQARQVVQIGPQGPSAAGTCPGARGTSVRAPFCGDPRYSATPEYVVRQPSQPTCHDQYGRPALCQPSGRQNPQGAIIGAIIGGLIGAALDN